MAREAGKGPSICPRESVITSGWSSADPMLVAADRSWVLRRKPIQNPWHNPSRMYRAKARSGCARRARDVEGRQDCCELSWE